MWSSEKKLFPVLVNEPPHPETGIIVVIPSFNEPDITQTLESLYSCTPTRCHTEVLVIINAPQGSTFEIVENNLLTIKNINEWEKSKSFLPFTLHIADLGTPPFKKWGVGMARKAGMDEALSRFLNIRHDDGVIVSLDADCTVKENYLVVIESELLNIKNRKGCSIYFEHPLEGTDFPAEYYQAAAHYELHLRYYYQALRYTGYPWVFHTVGSCMAVKASAYMMAGGMNRRQAGEDFYFIQKLLSAGGYFNLNKTAVYPSPRASQRVPFGTGATIHRIIENGEKTLLTYNPAAFDDLKTLFSKISESARQNISDLYSLFPILPPPLQEFISPDEWHNKIAEIKFNTSSAETFLKRFFGWFNMFRVIKFLNYVHNKNIYSKLPPDVAALTLLEKLELKNYPTDLKGLVRYFRKLEYAE